MKESVQDLLSCHFLFSHICACWRQLTDIRQQWIRQQIAKSLFKKGWMSMRPFSLWLSEIRHSRSFTVSLSPFTIYPFLTLQHLDQSYSRSYGGQRGGYRLAASLRLPCPIIGEAHILGCWAPTHLPSGQAECSKKPVTHAACRERHFDHPGYG